MSVTVLPAAFQLVEFDGARIAAVFSDVARRLGLPAELEITVEVDESSPLIRGALVSIDPPVITIEGGAFEDARRPRQLDERQVAVQAGRYLGRLADRLNPAFGEPPADATLSLAQADAWDTYILGRIARLGFETHQARWRYRFRMRQGFSDTADRVFDRLWAADGLTWSDLDAACHETEGARTAAP